MKKFWVVHNIPSPYRLHIFNAFWKECEKRGLEFHVHFMSDMSHGYEERPLSWRNPKMDFPYTYWKDYGRGQRHFNPGMLMHLKKERPEYILAGSPFDTLTGMLAARCAHAEKSCTWIEGNTKNPGQMGGIRGKLKLWAMSSFDYVAVPGSDGAKYIEMYQALTKKPLCKPILLPNLVDEARFRPFTEAEQSVREEVRASCGVKQGERMAILPSRFTAVKGLMEFVAVLTPEMLKGWKLVIIGDGEQREDFIKLTKERGTFPFFTIITSVPYAEMPKYYAAADVQILPSIRDQNPLSIVESLHSGLPIAISSEAGNIEEALTEGKNGWRLPVRDKETYIATLKQVFAADIDTLHRMGRYSLGHNAQFWNTEQVVRSYMDALTEN